MVEVSSSSLKRYVRTDATLVPQGPPEHMEVLSPRSRTLRNSPMEWPPALGPKWAFIHVEILQCVYYYMYIYIYVYIMSYIYWIYYYVYIYISIILFLSIYIISFLILYSVWYIYIYICVFVTSPFLFVYDVVPIFNDIQ